MMTDQEYELFTAHRDFLNERIESALNAFRDRLGISPEHPCPLGVYLQVVLEVLSYQLGYADAYACLGNVPFEERDKLRRSAFREGQTSKVEDHNADCVHGPACPELVRLLNETYPN